MAAAPDRHAGPRWSGARGRRELLLALGVLAALTAVFWATPLDLAAADLFRTPCCRWPMAEVPFWHFLYLYGVWGGALLVAAALTALPLSYWYPRRFLRWRRAALFLVLVAAIGPGLVVNVAFKDHYGRPRPREVQELGGAERFLPVWVPGRDREAKSFPCGHCSMGFYLATPYLVLRRRRRALAYAFAGSGLVAGGLLGIARMMAGGHFLSDVVWSAGMVWLVALALHRLLRVDEALERSTAAVPPARDRRAARLATALAGAALAVLGAGVLLATPYLSNKTFTRTAAEVAASPAARWDVRLDSATVVVAAGPELSAAYDVQAFGLPFSRMGWTLRDEGEAAVLSIAQRGRFTERRTQVELQLPADGPRPVRVVLGRGRMTLDLRGFSPHAQLEVQVEEGDVRVLGSQALDAGRVRLRVARGAIVRE
jgi:membrane-associated PAP2 superfamily phosphatase